MTDSKTYLERMRARQGFVPSARTEPQAPKEIQGPLDLVLDLDMLTVSRVGKQTVHFAGKAKAFAILQALCEAPRGYCTITALARAAWSPHGPAHRLEGSKRAVEVHVSVLRQLLKPLRVTVSRAVADRGYRLMVP